MCACQNRAAGRKRARVESSSDSRAVDDGSAHSDARPSTQRAESERPFRTGLWEVSECESLADGIKLHSNDWERVALVVGTRTAAQVEKFASRYLASSKFVRPAAEGSRDPGPPQTSANSTTVSNQSETKRRSLPPRPPSARLKSRESHEAADKIPSSPSETTSSPASDPRRRAHRSIPGPTALHVVAQQPALGSPLQGEQASGLGVPGSAMFSPLDPCSFVPIAASSELTPPPSRQPFTPPTAAPAPFSRTSLAAVLAVAVSLWCRKN
jgi:hypothetical protein